MQQDYAFTVTRIQVDNNIEMVLDAFSNQSSIPLVMVGNWQNSAYGKSMMLKFKNKKNLILLDAIYDRLKLDVLRSNCTLYIHGHSAGGTNPSLVEAMYLGLPIFAFASGFNEYTTENKAIYFKNAPQLEDMVDNYKSLDLSALGNEMKQIAGTSYRWDTIASKYHSIFTNTVISHKKQESKEPLVGMENVIPYLLNSGK